MSAVPSSSSSPVNRQLDFHAEIGKVLEGVTTKAELKKNDIQQRITGLALKIIAQSKSEGLKDVGDQKKLRNFQKALVNDLTKQIKQIAKNAIKSQSIPQDLKVPAMQSDKATKLYVETLKNEFKLMAVNILAARVYTVEDRKQLLQDIGKLNEIKDKILLKTELSPKEKNLNQKIDALESSNINILDSIESQKYQEQIEGVESSLERKIFEKSPLAQEGGKLLEIVKNITEENVNQLTQDKKNELKNDLVAFFEKYKKNLDRNDTKSHESTLYQELNDKYITILYSEH